MSRIINDEFAGLLMRAFGALPPGVCTTTMANTPVPLPAVTLKDIEEMAAAFQQHADSEPIRQWMISQGKSPDDGYVLILPKALARPFLPRYVHVTTWCSAPLLLRDPFTLKRRVP